MEPRQQYLQCLVCAQCTTASPILSSGVHSIASILASTLIGLDVLDKLIDDTGPSRVLAPEAESLIGKGLLGEHQSLIPHVLVDTLLVLLLKEFYPPFEPGSVLRSPLERWAGEQQTPVLGGHVKCDCLLSLSACEEESVLVDLLESRAESGQSEALASLLYRVTQFLDIGDTMRLMSETVHAL